MPAAKDVAPRSARAKALVDYLAGSADYPFGRFESVTHGDDVDLIDVIVEPELVQRRKVPILNEEPVTIAFPLDEDSPPRFYARRSDFPTDLVHTNFERSAHGCNLCVWEENWNDLRRGLTSQALFERIRSWFSKTADGTLHQDGQALEPMIVPNSPTLILPAGAIPDKLYVADFRDDGGRWTLCLDQEPSEAGAARFSIFNLTLPPQVHGALRNYPTTLADLRDLVAPMGVDLARSLGDWLLDNEQMNGTDRLVLIVVVLPKRKSAKAKVSGWDVWALQPLEKLFELGERLGFTARAPDTGQPGRVLGSGSSAPLDAINLQGWRVVQRLDRAAARAFAANKLQKDIPLVGVGAGAIGSNLMADTVRAGLGPWTVIDNDIALPHNLVRQLQNDADVRYFKAETSARHFNGVLAEGGHQAINANYLNPTEIEKGRIGDALASAAMAIDFSASPAVLGALADDEGVSRAASFFFNPEARDLVILCEDKDRKLKLDEIEAQYFRAAGRSPFLADHLDNSRADFVRYANACQDLTRPVPPWQVQALCGVGAGQLIRLIGDKKASAGIWQLDTNTAGILPMEIPLSKVHRQGFGHFRVTISDAVVAQMRKLRAAAAPDETGGILLGSFDLSRKIIHIVDALAAPPDSRQSPTYFERGKKDLKPTVDGISSRSAGVITYLGEWHSHPDRAKVGPSDDDEGVFAYLKTHLDCTGAPYLMVICGKIEVWLRAGWSGGEPGEATVVNG